MCVTFCAGHCAPGGGEADHGPAPVTAHCLPRHFERAVCMRSKCAAAHGVEDQYNFVIVTCCAQQTWRRSDGGHENDDLRHFVRSRPVRSLHPPTSSSCLLEYSKFAATLADSAANEIFSRRILQETRGVPALSRRYCWFSAAPYITAPSCTFQLVNIAVRGRDSAS